MDFTNDCTITEKKTESIAGIKFGDKVELYEFLSKHIKQEIIITGSTALQAYGLTNASDPFDLDLIIHKPTDETEKFLSVLSLFFPESEHEKTYMKCDAVDFNIGKLSMFRFQGDAGDYKVHIFYKNKPQQTMKYPFKGILYTISLPSDIFLAKRLFGRKKDYEQLAQICAKILT